MTNKKAIANLSYKPMHPLWSKSLMKAFYIPMPNTLCWWFHV